MKVVYSKETPIRPIEDMAICCRTHCICPPGTKRHCTDRMGSFIVMLILVIPQGVYATGNAVLIFMVIATGLAILSGILFTPRAWCTYCPMGTTTGRIRKMLNNRKL